MARQEICYIYIIITKQNASKFSTNLRTYPRNSFRNGNWCNTITLLTAAINGTKITQIGAKVAGTNAAVLVLIFISDTTGANFKLFDEIALAAITPSTTTTSQRAVTAYSDLQLKAGQVVKVGITVATAAGVNVFAIKGDY